MVLTQPGLHATYFMISLFFTTFFATHCHVCVFGAEHVQAAVTQSHGAIHGLYKAAVAGLIKDHVCTAAQLPPSAFRLALGSCFMERETVAWAI